MEKNTERIHFRDQLEYANAHGIPVDVEGKGYIKRPRDIIAVMQKGNYMVDYEGDEMGRIKAIHICNIDRHY
ncbi:MAG: hypothetical protein II915_00435 [Eubacterium sp.]|nr:hypothetical protein [Eubacterium sp.]MBQ7200301.1 hypothetical protein [Eubacterium sp.]MBR0118837.1 hypothetical protein [Eubacterium sp.]